MGNEGVTRRHLFGTDGVRGIANVEPMTSETALRLGRAIAHVVKRSQRRHKIIIGKDTRLSGYMLESALTSGICSMGVDVLVCGPMPTPGIAFLTRSLRADAGVVISASHNPFQDNGIKFFASSGFKLADDVEARDRGPGARRRDRRPAADGGRDRQGVPRRRRGRPLQRVPQEHLPATEHARRPDGGRRLRQRRRLPRRPRGLRRARRDGHRHGRRARRHQHQPRLRRAPPAGAGGAACARPARTSASRSTATPTASSWSTSWATWSTATRCWPCSASSCTAAVACRRRRWWRP